MTLADPAATTHGLSELPEGSKMSETKAAPVAVGLFVGIGSESFFSNLKITAR